MHLKRWHMITGLIVATLSILGVASSAGRTMERLSVAETTIEKHEMILGRITQIQIDLEVIKAILARIENQLGK